MIDSVHPSTEGVRLTVLLPCLNESRTIGAVIREIHLGIRAAGRGIAWSEVVVSDNGSSDGSRELALAAGARVVDCPVLGYGAALHWGIAHSHGDYVLFGDADMSYDFSLIARFVEVTRANEYDLVLASRLRGEIQPGAMPLLNRHLGTPALNLVIRLCFGMTTSDCNSGQRLIRREFYRQLRMRCTGMEWASELLIKTAIRKGRYREIPGKLRPDQRGRPPHMRRWRDGWRHVKSIVMLAPNRTILLPGLLLLLAGSMVWCVNRPLAMVSIWGSYAAVLVALGIKLLLHVDDLRPSRMIATILRAHASEVGLFLSLTLPATGLFLLLDARMNDPVLGSLLVAAGGLTLLAVLFFETVRTHLVSKLDRAWTPTESTRRLPSADDEPQPTSESDRQP